MIVTDNLKNLKLFVASIPFWLITGPFFSDLLVSLSSVVFIIYIFKSKDFKYFKNKSFIFFFIFYIYLCLNSLFISDEFLISIKSSLFYLRIGVFAFLIWYLIENEKNFLKYFYYIFLFSLVALILDGYLQFFFEKNIFGFKTGSGYRLTSFFNDQFILGSYLSRLLPLFFALFVIKKKKKYELYFIGLIVILAEVLIFLSGERASFFFFVLYCIFIIVLMRDLKVFRITTIFISLILIVILLANKPEIYHRMMVEPIKNMNLSTSISKKKYFFSKIHDSHLRTAFNMFTDKPLTGHGPKMFRYKCSDPKFAEGIRPCSNHPHNFYIQLLAETGIIGFSFLIIILIHVFYCSFFQFKSIILNKKKRYLTDYQVCLLGGILISVWPLSPNGNFFNNWLSIIYCIPFGFYLQTLYGKKRSIKLISFK